MAEIPPVRSTRNLHPARRSRKQRTLATFAKFRDQHMLPASAQPASKDRQYAGKLREKQNWIGGSAYNPCTAAFVPPPPELVPGLLEDLCSFCNADSLPAVAQAALAHAQFETVHPFADGNGRTGRGLIQLVLAPA
jgi:Fic family protein